MARYYAFARYLPSAILITAVIVLLQLLLPVLHVPSFIVPMPSAVLAQFTDSQIAWGTHIAATLAETVSGLLLAAAAGILLATVMVLSRNIRAVIEPIVVAAQVVPKVAFVPILFLWLGLNVIPRLLTVFLVCFFPVVIDSVTGLMSAEKDMVDLVRAFNPSRVTLLMKLRFPSALPSIFSGLKVASGLSLVGAVVSEFVSSDRGLGFLILSSEQSLNASLMFAAASILIIMGFILYGSVSLLEKVMIPWREPRND